MRHEVVLRFRSEVGTVLRDAAEVALVGGSPNDPELRDLPEGSTVDYYGIEDTVGNSRFHYLDLNVFDGALPGRYDLVISSQVLEHLWNVQAAIENLTSMIRPGGLIWLACPASNFPHGSPEYYSAGYTPELLSRLLSAEGLQILSAGCLGSQRAYVWTHALRHWPSDQELAHPVRVPFMARFRDPGPVWKRAARALIGLRTVMLLPLDASTRTDIDYATESWVLARRPTPAAA